MVDWVNEIHGISFVPLCAMFLLPRESTVIEGLSFKLIGLVLLDPCVAGCLLPNSFLFFVFSLFLCVQYGRIFLSDLFCFYEYSTVSLVLYTFYPTFFLYVYFTCR